MTSVFNKLTRFHSGQRPSADSWTQEDDKGKARSTEGTAWLPASCSLVRCVSKHSVLFPSLVVLVCFVVFSPHVLGYYTLIGDADRLNCHLNVRLHQYDGIREYGRVPAWSDRMFNGFSLTGLHWMLPEADPFAYLTAALSRHDLYWASGLISCLCFCAAGIAAYYCVNDFVKSSPASFIAAVTYVTSCASYTRILQVDWTYAVLIATPLGFLAVRRMQHERITLSYAATSAILSFLLLFTFLQEAAYALGLLVLYACFRAVKFRTALPMVIFALSLTTASILAAPRIISILEEFHTFDRTKSLQTTDAVELLRLFNEGVFGRFPRDARQHGNWINLHEGLQLYSSTFASILVIINCVRLGSIAQLAGSVLVIGSLVVVIAGSESAAWLLAAYFAPLFIVGASLSCNTQWRRVKSGHSDFLFHSIFLAGTFLVVLSPEVRMLLHRLCFNIDFTHSRIVVAALTPMSILLGMCVEDWYAYFNSAAKCRRSALILAAAISAGILSTYRPIADHLVTNLSLARSIRISDSVSVIAAEAAQVFVAMTAVFGILIVRWILPPSRLRSACAYSIGFLIVSQCVLHTRFQFWGAHTQSFPKPFVENNFLTVEPHQFLPPQESDSQHLQEMLESTDYRTAIVAPPGDYGAFVESHLAQFWRLRLLGGYCAGVPRRLATLPWKDGVVGLRTISFPHEGSICWGLLAMLNTKYVIILDQSLYFNHRSESESNKRFKIKIVKSDLEVLPRAFFAKRVMSADELNGASVFESDRNRSQAKDPLITLVSAEAETITTEWDACSGSNGHVSIERKDGKEGAFREVGTVPLTARSHRATQLDPTMLYTYRIRFVCDGKCSIYSNEESIYPASSDVLKPELITAERISDEAARVTVKATRGVRYIIESMNSELGTFKRSAEVGMPTDDLSSNSLISVVITGLKPSSTAFRVRSVRENAFSTHSENAWILASASHKNKDWRQFEKLVGEDLRETSWAEGIADTMEFSNEGSIDARYEQDVVRIRLSPLNSRRFLVLNELYHPCWTASTGSKPIKVFPVNCCMRGLIIDPDTTDITLRFVPFLYTRTSSVLFAVAGSVFILMCCGCHQADKRLGRPPRRSIRILSGAVF